MKKILYIEDDTDTAEIVEFILKKLGYKVELAFTGTEGVRKAQTEGYDLVLLDVMLPDISGWEVFDKIKGKAKIAFLSNLPVTEHKKDALIKRGASDYLVKPVTRVILKKKIKAILNE
jgi:DNA-binding response OmpR family regulator